MYLLTGETRINEHVNLIAPDRESQISLESEQEQEYTEKDWKKNQ